MFSIRKSIRIDKKLPEQQYLWMNPLQVKIKKSEKQEALHSTKLRFRAKLFPIFSLILIYRNLGLITSGDKRNPLLWRLWMKDRSSHRSKVFLLWRSGNRNNAAALTLLFFMINPSTDVSNPKSTAVSITILLSMVLSADRLLNSINCAPRLLKRKSCTKILNALITSEMRTSTIIMGYDSSLEKSFASRDWLKYDNASV